MKRINAPGSKYHGKPFPTSGLVWSNLLFGVCYLASDALAHLVVYLIAG
jgi:hypothetical protein